MTHVAQLYEIARACCSRQNNARKVERIRIILGLAVDKRKTRKKKSK